MFILIGVKVLMLIVNILKNLIIMDTTLLNMDGEIILLMFLLMFLKKYVCNLVVVV